MKKEDVEIVIAIVEMIILGLTAFFIYRTIYTPLDAVKIGRELNIEEQKGNAKRNLFLLLFSLRGNPGHYDFVRGLNEIDIVFEDNQTVLDAWHSHFRDLHDKNLTDSQTIWDVGRVRLLSAMAVTLGYKSLNQTDILQHYTPELHGNREKFEFDLRWSALKYFEKGVLLFDEILEAEKNRTSQQLPKKDQSDEQKPD